MGNGFIHDAATVAFGGILLAIMERRGMPTTCKTLKASCHPVDAWGFLVIEKKLLINHCLQNG